MTRIDQIKALNEVLKGLKPVGPEMDASYISGQAQVVLKHVLVAMLRDEAEKYSVYEVKSPLNVDAFSGTRFGSNGGAQ